MAKKHGAYKLNAETQGKITDAITAGNYMETAAAFAGISKDTLYNWLRRGAREKKGPYRVFSMAVEKALADAEVRDVATIAKAASQHWQAAAWRLERKAPQRWGRRTTVHYDNNKITEESLTSLIERSLENDPDFKDVGKGFADGLSGPPGTPEEETKG